MYELAPIIEGLTGVFTLKGIALMLGGVIASSIFAAMPGIGSLILLSMLLPYAMTLTPYECIALLLGIITVSNTANTFSSVLIAVPGNSGSQATIVDGFPMAQKGEANRAFGAAFSASMIGAVFGAGIWFLTLPIMRPLVLYFGSPAFMMLVIWGLSAVAVLGGTQPIKGLMAAVLGLAIATIGTDQRTGIERFALQDGGYLAEGVSPIIIALGVFAIPELISLMVNRTSVSKTTTLEEGGLWRGVKDTFENWWLVLRCSTIGVWIGILPGLGSSVADWFAYAHAVQSEKNPENFGKGDVRGVIAPESSNNAKEGGALIPTTLFGIPGSLAYALAIVAFVSVGIKPGKSMLTDQLPYLYAMMGVLVVANFFAGAIAMYFANAFARLSLVPFYVIVPVTLIFCVIAAFSVSYTMEDILTLLVLSTIGFFMKRFSWPRPPMLVAIVLGPQLENYVWLSSELYGMRWITHPDVLIIAAIIALTMMIPVLRKRRQRKAGEERGAMQMDLSDAPVSGPGDKIMIAAYVVMLALMFYKATDWLALTAVPIFVIASAGGLLAALQITVEAVQRIRARAEGIEIPMQYPTRERSHRELQAAGWLVGLSVGIWLLGFHVAFVLFPILFIQVYGKQWKTGIICGVAALAALLGIFDTLIHIVWPEPYLLTLLGMGLSN
jgi:TctA family transporter